MTTPIIEIIAWRLEEIIRLLNEINKKLEDTKNV